jgi:NAD(P)-dependent dehydrogenase (short-subunit alcohol dehydrogenase family)
MNPVENELRFDGRVAVITGAGRGLGRAYAKLLASRGAKIIVNDTGAVRSGEGLDAGPAEEVVREILAAGGEAVVCTESVATPQSGKAIIEAAMDNWGRLDILIQNAGNSRRAMLHEFSHEDFDALLDVHLRGAFNVVRPAYPIMRQVGYGRVVITASNAGLYGTENRVAYSVCKAGLIGLCNVVAREGAAHGVKANCILPGAITRLAEGLDTSGFPPTMTPEMVAPAVGWLAHETCSITGELVISMAGRLARAYFVETAGVFRDHWSIEDVAREIDGARKSDQPWELSTLTGFEEHIARSFAMNRQTRSNSHGIDQDHPPAGESFVWREARRGDRSDSEG